MNLGDLINAFGQDIIFQLVDECIVGAQKVQGGTDITIGTHMMTPRDLAIDAEQREKFGFVVWLDRKQMREILENNK